MKKRIINLLMMVCIMIAMLSLTVTVKAATNTVGPFRITGGTLGTDYTYASGVLTVKTSTPLDIANTTPATATAVNIVVPTGTTANITLSGVNIYTTTTVSPFEIQGTASVNLTLADGSSNSLGTSQFNITGLDVKENARLTIDGKGSLSAKGKFNGAGIGGGDYNQKNGSITINDGIIIAEGGRGAGIGSGGNSSGSGTNTHGNITINGGTITAISMLGAGIGTGYGSTGGVPGDIVINGGAVTALAGYGYGSCTAIGLGGSSTVSGDVKISKAASIIAFSESTSMPAISTPSGSLKSGSDSNILMARFSTSYFTNIDPGTKLEVRDSNGVKLNSAIEYTIPTLSEKTSYSIVAFSVPDTGTYTLYKNGIKQQGTKNSVTGASYTVAAGINEWTGVSNVVTYTVTWKSQNGATTLETDSNTPNGEKPSFNAVEPTKAATAQYTYAFVGWSTTSNAESGTAAGSLPAVSGDVTYYAAFSKTLRTYSVTWKSQDGATTLETDNNVSYGAAPSFNATVPTKVADAQYTYTFTGWSTTANAESGTVVANLPTVSEDVTYYAAFSKTARTYSVIWKSQDGVTTLETDNNVSYGATPSFNASAPTKAADAQYTYTFAGWSTTANAESGTVVANLPTVSEDVIYYAAFSKTAKTFSVTWKSQDGATTLETDNNVSYGAKPSFNATAPTKAADAQYTYTFTGWSTTANAESGTVVGSLPTVSGDVTYYAAFSKTAKTFSVTWKAQDGATTLETDNNVSYSATPSFDAIAPTKAADTQYTYTFAGWSTTANAESGTEVASLPTVSSDVTYYAAFSKTAKTFSVTWKSQDGATTLETDNNVSYGAAPSFDAIAPTKVADTQYTYTFAGWSTTANAESGTEVASLPTVSGDVTFYAAFSKTNKIYAITASPSNKDFGIATEGYANSPVVQSITITNTGNQSMTLIQPTSSKYEIGALSSTTLASGQASTFTIRPKTGLAAGSYDETITVSTTNNISTTVSVKFTVVPGLYTVSGTIKDTNNNVVTGAAIVLTNTVDTTKTYTGITDSNGTYSITNIPNGSYTLTVTKNGKSLGNGNVTVNGSNITGGSGDVTVNPEIPITPPASTYTVSGTIKDTNNNVVTGAAIVLTNTVDTSKIYTGMTDNTGTYSIANVPNGSYTIMVNKNGQTLGNASVTVNGSNITGGSGDVTVSPETPITPPVSTYTVSGTIKDTNNNVVIGATIVLTNTVDPTKTYNGITDNNGTYSITNVPNGSYTLTVTKNGQTLGNASVTVNGSNITGGSGDVSVSPETPITPPVSTYTVSGTIKDTNNNVVIGATIVLTNTVDTTKTYTGITDTNGTYRITNVPNGSYTITVTKNGVSLGSGSVTVNGSNISGGNVTVMPVTPVTPTPTPTPSQPTANSVEQIKAEVKQGDSDNTVSQIIINRTTDAAGNKSDTVVVQENVAAETAKKLKEEGKDLARIVIPDSKDDVSKTTVKIPSTSLDIIGNGEINLQIDTEVSKIYLPKESLNSVNNSLQEDLYFNIVPVKEENQKQEVLHRAMLQVGALGGNNKSDISVGSVPVMIETNMPSIGVDITLPLTGINIPTNQSERESFLSRLAVYIEHSDGDKELVKGEIVEYKEGVLGIKFHITKFSTFTIVQTDIIKKSSECNVTKVTTLKNAVISGKTITASVKNSTESLTLKVSVSDKATWKLYSDKACKKMLSNNTIKLKTGSNKAYLKVIAEDGTSKIYTLIVTRNKSVASNITKVVTPSKVIISGTKITATVSNNKDNLTLKVNVSNKATWQIYTNKQCTNVLKNKKLKLKVGNNKVYIKVTAEDGKTSKVYTFTITRQEASKK